MPSTTAPGAMTCTSPARIGRSPARCRSSPPSRHTYSNSGKSWICGRPSAGRVCGVKRTSRNGGASGSTGYLYTGTPASNRTGCAKLDMEPKIVLLLSRIDQLWL